jgi:hypothetical protein
MIMLILMRKINAFKLFYKYITQRMNQKSALRIVSIEVLIKELFYVSLLKWLMFYMFIALDKCSWNSYGVQ